MKTFSVYVYINSRRIALLSEISAYTRLCCKIFLQNCENRFDRDEYAHAYVLLLGRFTKTLENGSSKTTPSSPHSRVCPPPCFPSSQRKISLVKRLPAHDSPFFRRTPNTLVRLKKKKKKMTHVRTCIHICLHLRGLRPREKGLQQQRAESKNEWTSSRAPDEKFRRMVQQLRSLARR